MLLNVWPKSIQNWDVYYSSILEWMLLPKLIIQMFHEGQKPSKHLECCLRVNFMPYTIHVKVPSYVCWNLAWKPPNRPCKMETKNTSKTTLFFYCMLASKICCVFMKKDKMHGRNWRNSPWEHFATANWFLVSKDLNWPSSCSSWSHMETMWTPFESNSLRILSESGPPRGGVQGGSRSGFLGN